jgi:hypothetical protein
MAANAPLVRDTEVQIVSYLLERAHDEFDEELLTLCSTYAEKHAPLLKGLKKLRRKEREERLTDEPLAVRVSNIFDRPFDSLLGLVVFTITTALVLLSIIGLMLRSVPQYNPTVDPSYRDTWLWIEGGVSIYFTSEFIVRLVFAASKIDFLKRLTTIADFIALLPFYLDVITQTDIAFLQVFRIIRIYIFFRRFRSVDSLFRAVRDSVSVLGAPLVFLGTCLFIVSTVLYYSERGTYDPARNAFTIRDCECESSPAYLFGTRICDRKESLFFSIPHTLWWGVVTMTTVGYGDLVPTCPNGKVVAAVGMVLGVLFMAMPIAIVGNYFTQAVRRREAVKTRAILERARAQQRQSPHAKRLELGVAEGSPGIKFLSFLRERLHEPTLSIADPSPYCLMLMDYYFGTLALANNVAGHHVPAAVTYELRRVTPASFPAGSPASTSSWSRRAAGDSNEGTGSLVAAPKRLSLNQALPLIIGVPSTGTDLLPADILLPPADAAGVPFRMSQRHAVLTMPPQYSDARPSIRPLPGASIWVNGLLVPDRGVVLRQGDSIDFHGPDRPLEFQLEAVHPFALDL